MRAGSLDSSLRCATLGMTKRGRYARNDKEGALRSEFIMRVATLTTVDESGVGFSVVTGLMAGTGDGFPPSRE